MNTVPVTVVVLTKNEEDNIEECLQSVHGWADEILVVDDESTDRTVELAKKHANEVFHRKMENEGIHRNWICSKARNEWVLCLDADEMVSDELKEEIREELKDDTYHAFSLPLRTYIGNYWVQHSGWYPANKLRMFMKSRLKYEEVWVHPRPYLDGLEKKLTKDIIHKGYPDFAHFLASLNRQTTLEAWKWIKTGRKLSAGRATWRTLDRFFRVMIGKQGYKDGFIGLMIAVFASLYQIMSFAKYWEIKKGIAKDDPTATPQMV